MFVKKVNSKLASHAKKKKDFFFLGRIKILETVFEVQGKIKHPSQGNYSFWDRPEE